MKWGRMIFGLLGVLALGYMIFDYGADVLLKDFRSASWDSVFLVLTFIPTLFCFSVAWLCVTAVKGRRFSLSNIWWFLKMTTASIAWNNMTPFLKVGGEPAKVAMLGNQVAPRDAVTSVIVYNVIHMGATVFAVVLAAFLIPFFFATNPVASRVCFLFGFLGLVLLVAVVVTPMIWPSSLRLRFSFKARWKRIVWLRKFIIGLNWSVRYTRFFYRRHKFLFAFSFFLEVIARFIEGLTFYLAFKIMNYSIPFLTAAFLDVGRTFADIVFFFIPYQVGGREQSVLWMMKDIMDIDPRGYLAAVFMYRFVEVVWAIVGYFFWIGLSKRGKSRTLATTRSGSRKV